MYALDGRQGVEWNKGGTGLHDTIDGYGRFQASIHIHPNSVTPLYTQAYQ
jgi:hypothetical protein